MMPQTIESTAAFKRQPTIWSIIHSFMMFVLTNTTNESTSAAKQMETTSPSLRIPNIARWLCRAKKAAKLKGRLVCNRSDSVAHPLGVSQQLVFRPATSAGRSLSAPERSDSRESSRPDPPPSSAGRDTC